MFRLNIKEISIRKAGINPPMTFVYECDLIGKSIKGDEIEEVMNDSKSDYTIITMKDNSKKLIAHVKEDVDIALRNKDDSLLIEKFDDNKWEEYKKEIEKILGQVT